MLMVIFGAGASHGSASLDPMTLPANPPPLTEDLLSYPAIAAKYPASRAVIDYLERVAPDVELETGLARFAVFADVITTATDDWLKATDGRTNYLALFNYLLEWQETSREPIRLVTFNYDTLIEDALG